MNRSPQDDEARRRALGLAIRELREAHQMSQTRLSGLAGYSTKSPVTMSRIENGKLTPSPEKLDRIAAAFGLSVAELHATAEAGAHERTAPSRPGIAVESAEHPPRRNRLGNLALAAVAGAQAASNYKRQQDLADEVDALRREISERVGQVTKTQEEVVRDVLEPFFDLGRRVTDIPLELPESGFTSPVRGEERPGGTHRSTAEEIAQESDGLRRRVLQEFSQQATLGATGGVAAGAGAAAIAYAATAAFATASTGTAIAGLSGAAATSATLAALGGGSLAAGGLGVAGGMAVLGGIAALPTLIATGVVVAYKGRQLRRKAEAEAERLDVAELALADTRAALAGAEGWASRADAVLRDAATRGREYLLALQQELGPTITETAATPADGSRSPSQQRVAWTETSGVFKETFSNLTSLVVMILGVLGLPLLSFFTLGDEDRQLREYAASWTERVLADAAERLRQAP